MNIYEIRILSRRNTMTITFPLLYKTTIIDTRIRKQYKQKHHEDTDINISTKHNDHNILYSIQTNDKRRTNKTTIKTHSHFDRIKRGQQRRNLDYKYKDAKNNHEQDNKIKYQSHENTSYISKLSFDR